MTLRPIHRKVVRDLWHLRSQMLAIAMVVACGIAMFVTLRSMYGWLRDTQATYYEAYRFADVFASTRRAPAALRQDLSAIPGVNVVRTRVVMDVTLAVPGLEEPATGRLVGIPEERGPILNDLHLRSGRYLRPGEAGEVLASDAFARANDLSLGDTLSAVVNGRWQRLRIVGIALSPEYVYEIRGVGDIFPDNRRFGVFWIGERALATAFQMEGAFNDVSLTLAPGASEPSVLEAVDRLLAPYGGTGAYGRVDQISNVFLTGEIQETAVTSLLLPAIFLGVTAFLLNVVLARLVATQREQIAVLKAFGYTNASVAGHYLLLASGPVLIGATVGIAAGIWLGDAMAGIYTRFFQFPVTRYHQDWGVVATAFLVSAGAALAGAIGSVRRVVALPPAEAMRPEAPASFRPGVVERLGLGRLVPPAQRMMLRNIERRPVKAALAVVGIAFATAIVFTGWFTFDVMDVMKVIQFEEIQRSDVMVVFQNPRSASAGWALGQLDGVRRVEPFRMVPVRLRHAHRTRRAAVMGLDEVAELQRIVDRDGAVRPVPRGGLLLSGFLARRLAVEAGDTLAVEVLEGKRRVTPVVVAAVNEDILGTSVVMSRPALEDLLGEGGTISGAYLAVDDREATALYRRLKQTPAVGGVLVREAARQGFEQTIAESFWISISMMVLFACVIAAGVIYNGSRVALSERGRELASLRVLGFHRGEVARLLLSEQALLILVGLPVGFLMGWGLIWLIAVGFESELYRIPMIVRGPSYVYSLAVVAGAALFSFAMVRRRIWRLDLVAVLKTRE